MRRKAELSRETVTADQPLRLADACDLFFGGVLKPAALRIEARKGNLAIMRIAGKDFVTAAAIEEMKLKCLIQPQPAVDGPQSGDRPADRSHADDRRARRARLALLKAQLKSQTVAARRK